MTSTHPQDERFNDAPEPTPTNRTDIPPDNQAEYRDDRTDYRDDRTDYRDDRTGYRDDRTDYGATAYRDPGDIPTRKVRETKPAFLTTEFWFAAGGIAALIVIYLIEDDPSLDLFRTALLATLIGVAYIVSRGLAKAGSRTTRQPEDPRLIGGNGYR